MSDSTSDGLAGADGVGRLIIVMRHDASPSDVDFVVEKLTGLGAEPYMSGGFPGTIIGAIGDAQHIAPEAWEAMPGVERAVHVHRPFRFVSRDVRREDTVVDVGGVSVGGGHFAVMAGPCTVESREQLFSTAEAVRESGAVILRGDAFKPRTSPYSFQGLGEKALALLVEVRAEFGLPFVAEVVDPRDVEIVSEAADLIRVGTRNMANYTLLSELGRQRKPVMLKRGLNATVDEWLNAAEYIHKEGNSNIILCERGIRTFETATRNTLDISAVPVVKGLSHLPVVVDPSHSAGRRSLVAPLARAAVVAGSDGFMVDVHPSPDTALVDGAQAILPEEFTSLMEQVRRLVEAMGLQMAVRSDARPRAG